MSTDNTNLPQPATPSSTVDVGGENTKVPVAVGRSYAWVFWLGLFLALLLFGLFYWLSGDFFEKKVAKSELEPLQIQVGVLQGLVSEIDRYKDALKADVCLGTPLPSMIDRPVIPTDAPPDFKTLPELVEGATVMVLADAPDTVATGTAFFIAPGLLLTNYHVVENVITEGGQVYVTSKVLGGLLVAQLVGHSNLNSLRDYALLTVELPTGIYPTPLPLTAFSQRTQGVSSWGYPTLLTQNDPGLAALMKGDLSSTPEVIYSEGVISVIQEQGGLPLISHTAEVSSGNSGGPLINEKGQVVGINTMIQVDDKSSRQVNIALGSKDILDFISELGLTLPPESLP